MASNRRESPYITIDAEAPLDARWTAPLWFAWSRLLATCRLKRACTAETWPAAVLKLRTTQAASIFGVHPNKVRSTLDTLGDVASITVRWSKDHGGDLLLISVDNYAEYQKLGRPTSARTSAELRDPPHVPTVSRPHVREEEKNPECRSASEPAESTPPVEPDVERDPPEPDRPKPARSPDPVVAVWLDIQAAFGAYCGAAVPRAMNASRRAAIGAAIREGLDPVAIVHGYMAFHDRHGSDFDPFGHFTPDTVFRASHRAKYAEAAERAAEDRGPPPWPPRGRGSNAGGTPRYVNDMNEEQFRAAMDEEYRRRGMRQ